MRTAFPVFNGYAPKEGPKALPVDFDFTTLGTFAFDLMLENSEGVIQFVQSVYVDNSDNPGALTMRFAQTGQRLVIPANSQGQYPVICPDQTQVVMSCPVSALAKGRAIFMNVPMPYTQWGPQTINANQNVIVSPSSKSTTQNGSGVIASANTSQLVFSQNNNRLGLFIENPSVSTGVLYVEFGTPATTGSSIQLLPGQSYQMTSTVITTDQVNVLSTTAGVGFIAKQFVPGVIPSPSANYVDSNTFIPDTTFSLPNVNIGTPTANRTVMMWFTDNNGSNAIATLLINGIPATQIFINPTNQVFLAQVPTGSLVTISGTMVIPGTSQMAFSTVAIYDLASNVPFNMQAITIPSSPTTLAGSTAIGGFAIFMCGGANASSISPIDFSLGANTWSYYPAAKTQAGLIIPNVPTSTLSCDISLNYLPISTGLLLSMR